MTRTLIQGSEFGNFRAVDARFRLSGGWTHPDIQVEWLAANGIVGVLDLEFVPDESGPKGRPYWSDATSALEAMLADYGIEYRAIPMFDGHNANLAEIYDEGEATIWEWNARHPDGAILVKCYAGMSRSVSMLANWYCRSGLTLEEALDRIESADGAVYLSAVLENFLADRWRSFATPALQAGLAEAGAA